MEMTIDTKSCESAKLDITPEEIVAIKNDRKKSIDKLYDKLAKNENLPLEVHNVLREIGTLRHDIHSSSDCIFMNTKRGKMMEESLNAQLILINNFGTTYPELIPQKDISIIFNDMKHIADIGLIDTENMDDYITQFIDLKEEFNDAVTDMLGSVDAKYGTKYKPRGSYRAGIDTYEMTKTQIHRRYDNITAARERDRLRKIEERKRAKARAKAKKARDARKIGKRPSYRSMETEFDFR